MKLAGFLTSLIFSGLTLSTNAQTLWHLRNPFPLPTNFSGLAYGNDEFLAIGDSGIIATSSDGEEWFALPNAFPFRRVVFGNARFVAMGWDRLGASTNGVEWVTVQTPELQELTFLNGKFFAIGWQFLASSIDGENWTTKPLPENAFAGNTGFGNGSYVFIGNANPNPQGSPTLVAATSLDGVNWMRQTPSGIQIPTAPIAFGNGVFVRAGREVGYSTDGIHWIPTLPFAEQAIGLNFINDQFIAFGPRLIMTSTNGVQWTAHSFDFGIYGLAFGAAKYVGVGTAGAVVVSEDTLNWQNRHHGSRANLGSCIFADDKFVAVGADETTRGVALTSPDGRNWREALLPGGPLIDITYGNGKFVTVGGDHSVYVSQDGHDWSYATNNWDTWSFQKVTYGDGRFVAVVWGPFQENALFSSEDGLTWTKRFEYDSNIWRNSLTFGNGRFVASGIGSTTNLVSDDGITWRGLPPFPGYTEQVHFAFGNGRFIAVRDGRQDFASNQEIFTSTNAVDWTSSLTNSGQLFKDVQFCENQFVAISWRQTLFTSDDGATWKESAPNLFFGSVNSMAAGAGTFILVGSQGIILQRADDALTILSQTMRQSSDGIKRFSVETPLAINFDIESTTDFVNWSVLRHITGSSGYLEIEDNEASVREARFYRLRR